MSAEAWTIHNNRTLVTLDDLTTEETLAILRAEQPGDLQYWFAWREGMTSWNPVVTVIELDLNAPRVPRVKPPPSKPPPKVPPVESPLQRAPPTQAPPEPPKQLVTHLEPPKQLVAPLAPMISRVREDDCGQFAFDFGDTEKRDDINSNFEIYWMNESDSELEKADLSVMVPSPPDPLKKPNLSVVGRIEQVPEKTAKLIVEKDRRKYPRVDIRFKIVIQNDNVTFRTYSRNASLGGLALEVAIPPILMGHNCLIHVTDPQSGETIKLPGRLVANRDQTRYFSFFRASAESISKLQKWLQVFSDVQQVS